MQHKSQIVASAIPHPRIIGRAGLRRASPGSARETARRNLAMRREPKYFTVEVKRRPGAAKKPASFAPAPVEEPRQPADALFQPAKEAPAAPEPARRILPCLVTEAAIDAAQAEAISDIEPVRRRGRPRKEPRPDDLAPLAPRKRGRPRKNPVIAVPFGDDEDDAAPAIAAQPATVLPPLTLSDRAVARRGAVSALPRGERWKRRLPKVLR
jgi:hypothetical protein